MTVGVAAKSYYTYGFHSYAWTTAYKPADPALSVGVWSTFTAGPDADPTAIAGSIKINYAGAVTVYWGTRPGAYGAHSLPIQCAAGATVPYRITGLKRKTQYYINATANVQIPPSGGSLGASGSVQYGELSYTTT